MPYMKNADGSMGWVMPWRYVETEGECNPSTNYQREALYAAPQPVAVPGAVDYSDLDPTSQDREVIESIAECKGWNACRAAMLQPSSGALQLPDGWKLVPVEPTAEMISSGIAAHYERSQIQIHDRPAPGPMECAYVAMLNAAPVNPEFTTQWIPCSERMPEVGDVVLTAKDGYVNVGEMERSGAHCRYFTSVASGRELPADYWMPLPTAQQEPTK
ncbi:DUF551 domain-containing protein [Enterobacter sp.]|uniref:DUF551 domain-containing protein n=1 Tax=Enterobacter sp. TaxID=42895 RepID=UPI00296E687C|nr:DUF551 domain-containing protein [Enterobacter sp.]